MHASTRTLQAVLQGDRRFVIPVYQRPYVWDRVRQWEPLWADVEATALRLADARVAAHAKGIPASEADKSAPPHFLGAVVVEQYPTATGEIDVRSVVDGQQRLTTLQLLLRGALDALEEIKIEGPLAAKVRKFIQNDKDVVSGDELHKVWPRPSQQLGYSSAMASTRPAEHESSFAEARAYFFDAAREFLADTDVPADPYIDGQSTFRRASLLVATLIGLEPISKSFKQYQQGCELHKAQEVIRIVLPARHNTALPLEPGKKTLDLPPPRIAT